MERIRDNQCWTVPLHEFEGFAEVAGRSTEDKSSERCENAREPDSGQVNRIEHDDSIDPLTDGGLDRLHGEFGA
jgi:hypothetical protein